MAIDTLQKKASVISTLRPWYPTAVPANGSFDQADRQHMAWTYTGVLAPEVTIIPGEVESFTAILTLTPAYDSVRTINHVFAGLFDAQAAEGVL